VNAVPNNLVRIVLVMIDFVKHKNMEVSITKKCY